MMTKKQEIQMYELMYIFAFGKDRSFFYENGYAAIHRFLNENYFCDGLYYRTKLLTSLLHNDALVMKDKKQRKDFLEKSEKLKEYFNHLPI